MGDDGLCAVADRRLTATIGCQMKLRNQLATAAGPTDESGDDPERGGKSLAANSTLATQVYERLRDDIVLGHLAPDTKLTLDVLKERYGLGMTPLREALYRLSSSSLVLLEDRRGFRVAPVSPAHLTEVIELREAIETMLLRDAFKHGDLKWETQIVAAFHRLQRTADFKFNPGPYSSDWEASHRDFHFALLAAARLPLLREFHLSLWDHASRYRNLANTGDRQMPPDVFEDHRKLMEAVLSRDQEMATVLMRRHVSRATGHIMQSLFPQHAQRMPQRAEAAAAVGAT